MKESDLILSLKLIKGVFMNKIFSFVLVLFLITACSSQNNNSPEISVSKLGEYAEKNLQEVYTNNCDGANPRTTIIRSLQQEQTTFFQVDVEVGSVVRGKPLPNSLEIEIETKIKAAFGIQTTGVQGQSITIELETPPGKFLKHKIVWNEIRGKGIADLVYPNGAGRVSFEKLLSIALYDRSSELMICSGDIMAATKIPAPTPMLTYTPIGATNEGPSNQLLGVWENRGKRPPMPSPAGIRQVIFANGDIDNSGHCHVKEFGRGKEVQGLGEGTFQLWLITGSPEYIELQENIIRVIAANADPTGKCPYLQ